jgi:hypothetical protein
MVKRGEWVVGERKSGWWMVVGGRVGGVVWPG